MPVFHAFGPDHWVVLGLTGATGLACILAARPLRGIRDDTLLRVALAGGLVANEIGSWVYYLGRGVWGLPLQLCDLAVFLMAWSLVGRNRTATELAFCWGLAGSAQAVLTPDLSVGFPSYPWIHFFLGHCGIALSALYLAVRGRVRLTLGSVWRVFAISNLYVMAAVVANWRLGTNFGYLAGKPAQPSLLDYLGPWPYYIGSLEVVALGLFFCCLGLSRLIDRRAGGVA